MIIVTGMPGAGKDELVNITKQAGFHDLHMGNTVKEYVKINGIEMTDRAIGKFATEEREKYGMDIWARRTLAKVIDNEMTVIDGLRNIEELQYFKKMESSIFVVAVFANRKTRLERILKRDRIDDVRSERELIERDNRELSWGIGNVIALADYMIVNDSTLEIFKERVKDLLSREFQKKVQ